MYNERSKSDFNFIKIQSVFPLVLQARYAKLRKAFILFVISVRLSSRKNSAPIGRIFMKYDI